MLQIYYDFQAFFVIVTLFSCYKTLREWLAMIIISKEELQKRFGEFEKHIEIVVDWFCCGFFFFSLQLGMVIMYVLSVPSMTN